jgi:hypothetical protein
MTTLTPRLATRTTTGVEACTRVPGMLLLYEDHLHPDATTIVEHLEAFRRYSQFPVYPVNVFLGIPPALRTLDFPVTVFHYTLNPAGAWITPEMDSYLLARQHTYKVAIFQDEVYYFTERLRFLDRYGVDCLYTRHKPKHWQDVYGEARGLKKLVFYLAGYVAAELVETAERLRRPLEARPIDVGYRGRRLPFYLGRGAIEKSAIADGFLARAVAEGFSLDIKVDERHRLYGEAWHRFLADCKAVLGVEGGVSIIDPTDTFRKEYERLIGAQPDLTFEQFAQRMGERFTGLEDRIDYRAFTPRHFEAAAFRNAQVLFEGRYDGMLRPGVHYLALRKDFSNLQEVLAQLRNFDRLGEMVEQTHRDLIASGRYSYQAFIHSFDEDLLAMGVRAEKANPPTDTRLRAYLEDWEAFRRRYHSARAAMNVNYAKPDLRRHVCRVQSELEHYARIHAVLRLDEYTLAVRRDLQERDRGFWRKMCRAAHFDLGIGCEQPFTRHTPLHRVGDRLWALWRRLKRLRHP